MPTVQHRETFSPVLLSSQPLAVSAEQKQVVREILEIGASDSKFAAKMYDAIYYVLTAGSVRPPIISSLSPNSAVLGSPSFTLNVIGTGFKTGSKIIWNGSEEPTTVVSATHLTTGVDMSTASAAVSLPVSVLNPDGVMSDPMTFTFISDAPALTAGTMSAKKSEKFVEKESATEKKLAVEEHHEKGSE